MVFLPSLLQARQPFPLLNLQAFSSAAFHPLGQGLRTFHPLGLRAFHALGQRVRACHTSGQGLRTIHPSGQGLGANGQAQVALGHWLGLLEVLL